MLVLCSIPVPDRAAIAITVACNAGFTVRQLTVLMPARVPRDSWAHRHAAAAIAQRPAGAREGSRASRRDHIQAIYRSLLGRLTALGGVSRVDVVGIGAVLVCGPLLGALSGPGSHDDLMHALMTFGSTAEQAQRFQRRLLRGEILCGLVVADATRRALACDILAAAPSRLVMIPASDPRGAGGDALVARPVYLPEATLLAVSTLRA
jgi:hypothetical protein